MISKAEDVLIVGCLAAALLVVLVYLFSAPASPGPPASMITVTPQVLECPIPDLSNMQPGDTMTVRCEVKK